MVRFQTGFMSKPMFVRVASCQAFCLLYGSGLGDDKHIKKKTQMNLRRRFTSMLEDLDYADDIALLASNCTHMQEKSSR